MWAYIKYNYQTLPRTGFELISIKYTQPLWYSSAMLFSPVVLLSRQFTDGPLTPCLYLKPTHVGSLRQPKEQSVSEWTWRVEIISASLNNETIKIIVAIYVYQFYTSLSVQFQASLAVSTSIGTRPMIKSIVLLIKSVRKYTFLILRKYLLNRYIGCNQSK